MMELDWLKAFNWEIHQMMYEDEHDFLDWIEFWHSYEKKAEATNAKQMQKLAPIETNIRRNNSVHNSAMMSPDGPIPVQYQHGAPFDPEWSSQ